MGILKFCQNTSTCGLFLFMLLEIHFVYWVYKFMFFHLFYNFSATIYLHIFSPFIVFILPLFTSNYIHILELLILFPIYLNFSCVFFNFFFPPLHCILGNFITYIFSSLIISLAVSRKLLNWFMNFFLNSKIQKFKNIYYIVFFISRNFILLLKSFSDHYSWWCIAYSYLWFHILFS